MVIFKQCVGLSFSYQNGEKEWFPQVCRIGLLVVFPPFAFPINSGLTLCALLLILVVLENQNLLVASAVEVAQRKFKSSNFAYNLSTFLQASQNLKLIDCKFQFHKTTTNEISSNAPHSKTTEIEK